ncbi:T9SS type A sorting domain-containing protein [Seonamhaeicola sp. ML3]|uniref:T9SS type A sorting domain-containing protein n=1 Tax=Seonamhaeicola sp. ML3 TaxID=2937786 RepID=UPI00200E8A3D|nr:T9SS type A sorting domain-containing protein [Seonamhaeicola sp. ML3]
MPLKLSILVLLFQVILKPPIANKSINSDEIIADNFYEKSTQSHNGIKIVSENNVPYFTLLTPAPLRIESLTIFDLSGKQLYRRRKFIIRRREKVPTRGLKKGIYLVQIETKDQPLFSKTILINN